MTCAEINELLTEFIMGELPPTIHQAVTEHIKHCGVCQQQYQWFADINGKLYQWQASIETPSYLASRWEQALQQQVSAQSEHIKDNWLPKKIVGFFATVVLLITASWGLGDSYQHYFDTQPKEQAPREEIQRSKSTESTPGQASDSASTSISHDEGLPHEQELMNQISRGDNDAKQQVAGNAVSRSAPKTVLKGMDNDVVESQDEQQPLQTEQKQIISATVMKTVPVIEAEAVERLKIQVGEESLEIAEQSLMSLLIQGINEASPAEIVQKKAEIPVSHTIYVTLDNDMVHTFRYSEQTNLGYGETLFGNQAVIPGPSLQQVLVENEELLTN